MIQPVTAAATPPIAYAGGAASTSKPSFGASLQATLAQLQATNQGITSAHPHHHAAPAHATGRPATTASDAFGTAPFSTAALTAPAL